MQVNHGSGARRAEDEVWYGEDTFQRRLLWSPAKLPEVRFFGCKVLAYVI